MPTEAITKLKNISDDRTATLLITTSTKTTAKEKTLNINAKSAIILSALLLKSLSQNSSALSAEKLSTNGKEERWLHYTNVEMIIAKGTSII